MGRDGIEPSTSGLKVKIQHNSPPATTSRLKHLVVSTSA